MHRCHLWPQHAPLRHPPATANSSQSRSHQTDSVTRPLPSWGRTIVRCTPLRSLSQHGPGARRATPAPSRLRCQCRWLASLTRRSYPATSARRCRSP
jgi:hypothetical protein